MTFIIEFNSSGTDGETPNYGRIYMTSYGSAKHDVVVVTDQSHLMEDHKESVSDHEEEEIIKSFFFGAKLKPVIGSTVQPSLCIHTITIVYSF